MTGGDPFSILAYGVGLTVFWLASRSQTLDGRTMFFISACGAFFGALGAKLTQALLSGVSLQGLALQSGGKSLLGGIVCGWAAVEIAKWRLGVRRSTGDLFALALPAGEAVGRIGCWLNQCCYGVPWEGPWACYQRGAWRHPTQLYSVAAALFILAILIGVPWVRAVDGRRWQSYLVLFAVSRFFVEMLREGHAVLWGLSAMQLLCLEIAILVFVGAWLRHRKWRLANRP